MDTVNKWNAVDIRHTDGIIRHGFVVDKTDYGLVINLSCGSQPVLQTVLFHQLRLCSDVHLTAHVNHIDRTAAQTSFHLVEALLQISKEPCTWYPARLLAYDRYHQFAFVEAQTDQDVVVREILPSDHVRAQLEWNESACIRPSDFHKEVVILPADLRACLDIVDLWNHVTCSCRCLALSRAEQRGVVVLRGRRRECWNHVNDVYAKLERLKSSPSQNVVIPAEDKITNAPDINTLLPTEILVRIFRFMDTYEQTRIRTVCSRWKDVLASRSILNHLRIHLHGLNSGTAVHNSDMRKLATCVHKYVTGQTRQLVIEGKDLLTHGDSVIPLIRTMMEACGNVRMKTLALSNMILTLAPSDEWSTVHSICSELVLRNVVLMYSVGRLVQHEYYPVNGRIRLPVGNVARAIWELVERSVGQLSCAEMQRLAQWIKQCDPLRTQTIVMTLQALQDCGVMDKGIFLGKQWEVSDLARMDVSQLPGCVQYTLIKEMAKNQHVPV